MTRKHWIVLTAYTVSALVLSWPLPLVLASAIPGVEGDAPSFVWALGWLRTGLFDLGVNPFHTDFVFYPLGGATQLMWAASLAAVISIPLQYLLGLVAAYNLVYISATVLTAFGTFLLAEEVLRSQQDRTPLNRIGSSPLPPFQTMLLARFVLEARRRAARRSPLPPFVAGLVFAFAPLRLGYGLAFFNLFNTQFIPLYVLFLMRALRRPTDVETARGRGLWSALRSIGRRVRRREVVVAGGLLGLNAYIDFQVAAFLVLFTGMYGAYVLVQRMMEESQFAMGQQAPPVASAGTCGDGWWAASPRLSRAWPVVLAVTLIGVVSLFVVAPMLTVVANDFAVEGGNYIRVFPIRYSTERSYDLLSFVVPHAWGAMYSGVPKIPGVNAGTSADDTSALSPDRQAFVGYITLALAAWATLTQWRRARFWFLAAVAFALFSLGPSLHILGRDIGLPLPYLALHEIPIVNHIRIPMRYGLMVSFALAMLVAVGIDGLTRRLADSRSRGFDLAGLGARQTGGAHPLFGVGLLVLPLLILAEYAILPYPVQPMAIPGVYASIARNPGNFTVLEIPTFNWRYAAAAEVYQAVDGKRLLRAYTNRIAPGLAEYLSSRGTPIVVRSLRVLEGAEAGPLSAEDMAEDLRVRDEVVRFFDLRYAVVHRQFLRAGEATRIDAYLKQVLGARQISEQGETLAYEIPRPPPGSGETKIDLRENIGQMYAGRGWQFEYPPANFDAKFNFVWARGARSEIYFVSRGGIDRTMTIHAYADPPSRTVIVLNGNPIGEIPLSAEWKDYALVLPSRLVQDGMNRVELQYGAELKETVGVTTITIR